ncbi:MAG: flagellar basal body P-ring protein FlgI, partial [bacterium]|nr:flagellar basal body P-ring protein FlgI [bacterium]
VVPRTTIDVTEERNPVQVFESTTTVGDLAQALNVLGVSPRDISSIFQQLKSAGALHAELELK